MKNNSTRNKLNNLHKSTNNNVIKIEINENTLSKIFTPDMHKYPSFVLYDSGWTSFAFSEIMGG
ncbi:MAG: hypothetical protein M0R03_16935 [Novosphingobium sp.]|nr:hypothetical protein [Novosphingobium sp.]